jgi:hypothetical protein
MWGFAVVLRIDRRMQIISGRDRAAWRILQGLLWCCSLWGLSGTQLHASITFQSLNGFLHYDGALPTTFDNASLEFISGLDINNLGTFQIVWTNGTPNTVTGVKFVWFLDADIDRDDNGPSNEYGDLISNFLPIGAPVGAVTFTQWEIDEPGFVFGDIYDHALDGALDNLNGVPSAFPDDVSFALLFALGDILPGQSITLTGVVNLTDAAGLGQFDPGSDSQFYFNG